MAPGHKINVQVFEAVLNIGEMTFKNNLPSMSKKFCPSLISINITYSVHYDFGGILAPINADGSSIFKLGSTIPVKFQLTDAQGNFVTDAAARLNVLKISNGIVGTEWEDAVSTSAATTGNLFRYDLTDNEYIFNLATKPLSAGTWQLKIDLDDGTSQDVRISLRK